MINKIDGLVQDCSNSNVLAMKLLQSCTKPSISNPYKTLPFLKNKLKNGVAISVTKSIKDIASREDKSLSCMNAVTYPLFSTALWYLQCISNGDIAVLHQTGAKPSISNPYKTPPFLKYKRNGVAISVTKSIKDIDSKEDKRVCCMNAVTYPLFSTALWYLQCISNGDTAVLHEAIDIEKQ